MHAPISLQGLDRS